MRIGFYNPYFNALGGGERYTLSLASHWSKSHEVFLFWHDDTIRKKAEIRLKIDLSRVKTTQNIFRSKKLFKKLFQSSNYDLIFFLSDGSIPLTLAKHNILHFQNPFSRVNAKNPIIQFKLKRYEAVVCNSRFTKYHIDQEYGVESKVVYPPVLIDEFKPKTKQKIILSVGRFSKYYINKRQKEMVQLFEILVKKYKGWRLYLAGGLLDEDRAYFEEVERAARGLPVRLFPNIPFSALQKLYSEASVYWHAAGFDVDAQNDPAGLEHFGIAPVEAMAGGCIPIVFNGGGLPEIIQDNVQGMLWSTGDDLIKKTSSVIDDKKLQTRLQKEAMKRVHDFSEKKFIERFDAILAKIAQ